MRKAVWVYSFKGVLGSESFWWRNGKDLAKRQVDWVRA